MADWGQSLGGGAPGIALWHIEQARAGLAGWEPVHRLAIEMTRAPVHARPETSSLFRGAPAVAYALHTAGHPAYAAALATLDAHIERLTSQRLATAHERINQGQLPALGEFDLISGLTGLGAYQLHRHPGATGGTDLLRAILSYLARLTNPITIGGERVPGWWTAHAPDDRPSSRWPGGHGNLGMAHGITGPLALLSKAMKHGVTVPGQADAIERICSWLDQWTIHTEPGPWWPETLTRTEHHTQTLRRTRPPRPSWCYGTPGQARAQQLAGQALADPARQHLAEHALAAASTDPRQLTQLTDTSLCHGWAGLAHTTGRAARDSPDGPLAGMHAQLLAAMQAQLDQQGPAAADGLLEGVAGVRLVQNGTTVEAAATVGWDACLLAN